MANPPPGASNGPWIHGSQGAPSSENQQPAFSRPFSLHEALPYTPFSSIVPFDPSILPTPSIGSASPAPNLSDLVSSKDFDALNQEARGDGAHQRRLQQTLSQVQHLIERGGITEYNFKTGPKRASSSSTPKPLSLASGLSPFSKMIYDQTAVPFRYPTPDTPSSASPNDKPPASLRTPSMAKPRSPIVPPKTQERKPSTTLKNKPAQSFARFEIVLPTKSQLEQKHKASASPNVSATGSSTPVLPPVPQGPQAQPVKAPLASPQSVKAEDTPSRASPPKSGSQPPSGSQRPVKAIAIELPRAASFNKNEYQVVPDEPDEPASLSSRKRKRGDLGGDELYGDSLDLRQRADAALNELRVFLQYVFEAEDYAHQTRTSNDVIIFTVDNETALVATIQAKAHTLLQKTMSLNCFQSVPLDHLLRLLRFCEAALKQAESLDIKVMDTWVIADVEQWVQQLPLLEIAIKAARTALRTMCGGRQDKQLYSEDTIEKSLDLFKRIMDGIVIPIAELRSSDRTSELFKSLSSHKKKIVALFTDCQKLFSVMSEMLSKIDTSDTVTNTLEFAASSLIFIETANAERDSVIDTQKFDGFRLVAMDMLSQIFLLNPAQRQGIFDGILTSLEKLPLGKRARTFKLVDGTSIQPVSALIMRLVQTSAGKVDETKTNGRVTAFSDEAEDGAAESSQKGKKPVFSIRSEEHAAIQHSTAIQELSAVASPLMDTARHNASYVVSFIVNRALKSTKSGDTPYRNLLDLFVEDFTVCLDNPDWPAAEMLLRLLMMMMFKLVEGDKTSVTAKNMALEILGIVGAAISNLRGHVRKTASGLDGRDSDELGMFLSDLASAALELKSRPEHMVAWTGPYRATVEYLESRFTEDPHLASAITFIVSDWGNKVCAAYDHYTDDFEERDQELGRNAYRLRQMVEDRRWLSNEFSFKEVSPSQAKLSYSITLLRSQLSEAFSAILNLLLGSMTSDQPTVRSKSLKCINQVIESDPSILDGDSIVIQRILRCSNDSSTQVRDSALGLIGKCISMRPALEEKLTGTVVDRFIDTGPTVRKRAMKLAKDIYLRNRNKAVRSAIANGLLHRVQDPEESVRDLARQVIEEIWFAPFYDGENSATSQISLAAHVALMVQTVKQGGNVGTVLDKVLQALLAPESKTAQASLGVCTKLVASMFDLVDNPDSEDPSVPSGRDALQVLMIFSKADANLFTFEQLRLLKPHISSIRTSEDLAVSRAVVVIYRRVLPQLSSAHTAFLAEVRKELTPAVSKVSRALLDDIMACLWIISTLLETSEHLARLVLSSLQGIQKLRTMSKSQPLGELQHRQFERYSLIVGMAGKHCDLDSHLETFKKAFAGWNGATVSKLMVDVLIPWASPSSPLELRKAALDAVGLICQASPRNYAFANVFTTFEEVFNSQIPVLESQVLRSFREFLFTEEKRSEQASEAPASNGVKSEKKQRNLTVIGGTNYDDVASATTQRFMKQITRIATSTQDDHAYLAVEVLASINRQGLVHPKETGVTLITLETSSNPRISELAYLEHKALHGKHETVVEREYVKAIQSAFAYQRDIVKDPRGATMNPFTPKLHLMMEVLKISKSKNRQKFLEKFCGQVDFDLSKLEITGEELPPHVQYSRFIIENLAYFEYLTVGELHTTVSAMEKLFTSTGATVAQAIESELFQVTMEAIEGSAATQNPVEAQVPQPDEQPSVAGVSSDGAGENGRLPDIDPKRLRQLAAGSVILLAVWEARTHLRRLYGMGTNTNAGNDNRRESGGKPGGGKLQGKDLSRAPVKVPSVTGDKVWEEIESIMTGMSSKQRMIETCKAFVELMNVDKEFLVQRDQDDEEMMDGEGPATPGSGDEMDDDEEDRQPARRGRKRKIPSGGNTTPGKKKRARSSSQPRKRGRPRKVVATEGHHHQQSGSMDAEGELEDEW